MQTPQLSTCQYGCEQFPLQDDPMVKLQEESILKFNFFEDDKCIPFNIRPTPIPMPILAFRESVKVEEQESSYQEEVEVEGCCTLLDELDDIFQELMDIKTMINEGEEVKEVKREHHQ